MATRVVVLGAGFGGLELSTMLVSGPTRTGAFNAPCTARVAEKDRAGSSRRARWFAGR